MRGIFLSYFGTVLAVLMWLGHSEQTNGLTLNLQPVAQVQTELPLSPNVTQLIEQGRHQRISGQLREALQTFQQILAIHQLSGNELGEAEILNEIGKTYTDSGQYQLALTAFQKALLISRKTTDSALNQSYQHQWEGRTLSNLGAIYSNLGQKQAIEVGQQALLISREVNDRAGEAQALYNLGGTYTNLGQYDQAFKLLQQALPIFKDLGDYLGEGRSLQNLGLIYRQRGQYSTALATYEQSAQVMRKTGDALGQGRVLNGTGLTYYSMGDYSRALQLFQQSLKLRQTIGERLGEAYSLSSIGLVYASQGDYPRALKLHQQTLGILTKIGSPTHGILSDIGGVYYSLNQYSQALEFYQKALDVATTIGDRSRRGRILGNLANVYSDLGQPEQALELYRQALSIHQANGERPSEAATLNGLGVVYQTLDQLDRALEVYQEAFKIRQSIGDQVGMGATLNNIGLVYDRLGQSAKALDSHQQALFFLATTGNRAGEGLTLNNIGLAYYKLEQPTKAIKALQEALGIVRQIGDRGGESVTLSNLGYLFAQQKQPQVAITFYKESVNLIESIRSELRSLPKEQQESYTKTVADTYRQLADLLLSQGRILEAQQVLELLKVQELQNFDRRTRAKIDNGKVELDPTEQAIVTKYGSFIAFGQRLRECQASKPQCAEIDRLNQLRTAANAEYTKAVALLEAEISRRKTDDNGFLNPNHRFSGNVQGIVEKQPNTALIYSLVTDENLWLVLVSKGETLRRFEVKVSQVDLNGTVVKFRQLIEQCEKEICDASDMAKLNVVSQQLYTWLFPKPLQQELQGKIKHLVFAQDRITRYIPMSALFDGKQYLIENYTVSTIVSAEFTNTEQPNYDPKQITVLAAGLSNAAPPNFRALANVPLELAAIVQTGAARSGVYQGLELLNQRFNFSSLQNNIAGHNIIHIATHGVFVRDQIDGSYILLGTGERLPISKIKELNDLGMVHLVVLSACQTALADRGANGIEISNVSYSFLERGVKAVIASLWQVNDASTSLLMQQFYKNLATGKMTKSEALRQAQLDLLNHKIPPKTKDDRAVVQPETPNQPTRKDQISPGYSHPYYWAPFILIGNGL